MTRIFAPCMGGWCALRDHCPHFHAELRGQPSERLCTPGKDGTSHVMAVRIVPPATKRIPSQEIAS